MLNKLQKADKDTNDLIDMVKNYLFSVGIRTSRERAWDVFQAIHKLPYKLIANRNPSIVYQGQGQHILAKHGNQLLVIKEVGRFELKGVSSKKGQPKHAAVKFIPSADIQKLIGKIEVKDSEDK
jgi:hypothetical protein